MRTAGQDKDAIDQHCLGVLDQDTGQVLEYRNLLKHPKYKEDWSTSVANEFGRLAQGVGNRIKGMNTIKFISKQEVPKD